MQRSDFFEADGHEWCSSSVTVREFGAGRFMVSANVSVWPEVRLILSAHVAVQELDHTQGAFFNVPNLVAKDACVEALRALGRRRYLRWTDGSARSVLWD